MTGVPLRQIEKEAGCPTPSATLPFRLQLAQELSSLYTTTAKIDGIEEKKTLWVDLEESDPDFRTTDMFPTIPVDSTVWVAEVKSTGGAVDVFDNLLSDAVGSETNLWILTAQGNELAGYATSANGSWPSWWNQIPSYDSLSMAQWQEAHPHGTYGLLKVGGYDC